MFNTCKSFPNGSEKLAGLYNNPVRNDSVSGNTKSVAQIIIQTASSVFGDFKFGYSSSLTSKYSLIGTTHWPFANVDVDHMQSLRACFSFLGSTAKCFSSISNAILFLAIISTVIYLFHFATRAVKRMIPNAFGVLFSILTWYPIVGALLFYAGYSNIFNLSQLCANPWEAWHQNRSLFLFVILASFKGVKIVVHTISYYLWNNPAQLPLVPSVTVTDVTVIVPSVGDFDGEFVDCIQSILDNRPARVIIVTTYDKYTKAMNFRQTHFPGNTQTLRVLAVRNRDKRQQFIHGVNRVETAITAYADDHVFWPPTFLRSCLAALEDPLVGLVGTVKRVRRDRRGTVKESFLNYIACIYLERHNFECTASYNIDGGVFVMSGRTALVRTDIIQCPEYRNGFLSERWGSPDYIWGESESLKVDDDNFTTRFMVNHGYKTVFHNRPDALMETTLGVNGVEKFEGQLIRWARTTWRSNITSLFRDRICWREYPWTTYAMFISALVNVAFLWDFGLIFLLYKSHVGHMCTFVFVLFLTKLIKPLPHLIREPKDIGYFFLGILFGWYHGYVKFYALYTFKDVKWLGRPNLAEGNSTPMDRATLLDNTVATVNDDLALENFSSNTSRIWE